MRFKHWICLLPFVLTTPAWARITLNVEPSVASESETLELSLRFDDTRQVPTIDLGKLEKDFDLLDQRSSSELRSNNGQVSQWAELIINIRPKHSGQFTIGPFSHNGEQSQAVEITIRAMLPELKQALDQLVFFETETSAQEIFVQAELLFTRRLFYIPGVQIYSALPGAPELADTVVVTLDSGRSYTDQRFGRDYSVIEQRYALYPEHSGSLHIPGVALTSNVRYQQDGRMRRTAIRAEAKPVDAEVLPIPAQYPADQPWLPARSVSIDDRLIPESLTVTLGESLTRKITVQVSGNIGSAIPELMPASEPPGFKQYPAQAVISESLVNGNVQGQRLQDIAMIPFESTTASLTGLRLTWWDVTQQRVRQATSPGYQLTIVGNPARSTSKQSATASDNHAVHNKLANPATGSSDNSNAATSDESRDSIDWAAPGWQRLINGATYALPVALLLFAGWFGWERVGYQQLKTWRDRKRRSSRFIAQQLDAACNAGDPVEIHRQLIRYIHNKCGMSNTAALEFLNSDPAGKRLLDDLNDARFGSNQTLPDIRQCLTVCDALIESRFPDRSAEPLPPLYSSP